jgi:hypothetical protein
MSEWIVETVRWFCRRPDWQLVVRCHPGELEMPSAEPVEGLIASHFPDLPENIKVVRPGDDVNTYALMQLTDLGLVYVTTTGLEMAARGIPVITTGKSHYCGKGFTTDPQTPAAYFEELGIATGKKERLSNRQMELARCYIYVYNHQVSKPFPWGVTTLADDLKKWPIEHMMSEECPELFAKTFDYLAGHQS